MYISTYEELSAFCERAARFNAIAVDTEFLRERTYHPRLCLVQVATPDECVVIDVIAIDNLAPLAILMRDEGTVKVFHACSQDMEVLNYTLGALPAPIFDTQIAAAFLGERMQTSYNGMVHAFCGVTLPKSESLTDWSRRPLTPEQIEYALDDVRYLIKAYDVIMERLDESGRASWVLDEIRPLTDRSHYVVDRRVAFKRVKRVNSLTRRQLAVARELAAWREARAEYSNIPRKWLMSDEVLIALSKRPPHDAASLRRVRGTEQLSDADVAGALSVIARGESCPADKYPFIARTHKPASPELESVIDLMYALIRLVGERSGVATAMIASRDDLVDYVDRPQDSPLREGWRFELVGTLIDDLLNGDIGLTVKDRALEIL
ncbi:ribonuclease D [Collinsella sp. UBA1693]|jgi:ribonuclease D|uniref:ribonuclease D n=1 Tax=Collinsella sp. UBA1693 TaxID=1946385 RepID=UPI00257ECED5|nr:ribonuclease D [Collinsella sp. UBA1693]